jgi:hypothetical protein
MLRGRHVERARLDRLLADAWAQRSSALVIRGAPGVGKSVLLDYAAEHAGGLRVLRGCGVESEVELPFAALHQLLYPMRDRLDVLPRPQATAVRAALGLGPPHEQDRFLVATGVLTLLGELATEPGLLCLVDDVQWLDGPSTDVLLFSARRLEADGVALVFALRETGDVESRFLTAGLTELQVSGLDTDAARALLADRWSNVDPSVLDRIIAEAAGNPLALTELPTLLTEAQLRGDEPLPQPLPIGAEVRRMYAGRLHLLSPGARRLIEIAAAEDTGAPATLLAAASPKRYRRAYLVIGLTSRHRSSTRGCSPNAARAPGGCTGPVRKGWPGCGRSSTRCGPARWTPPAGWSKLIAASTTPTRRSAVPADQQQGHREGQH